MYKILSLLAVLSVISIIPSSLSEIPPDLYKYDDLGFMMPSWIKNTAGWWASDQIPDSAFLDGMEYLINVEIIILEIQW